MYKIARQNNFPINAEFRVIRRGLLDDIISHEQFWVLETNAEHDVEVRNLDIKIKTFEDFKEIYKGIYEIEKIIDMI